MGIPGLAQYNTLRVELLRTLQSHDRAPSQQSPLTAGRPGPLSWVGSMETAPDLEPDYSEDGVDLTLIRWMLSLTPAERLEVLEQYVNDIRAIRQRNARK